MSHLRIILFGVYIYIPLCHWIWGGGFLQKLGVVDFAGGIVVHTAFINTDIAGSIAMVTWLLISWKFEKKPTLIGALTGAVAGLATITPAAGYVRPWAAVIIGILASIVCYLSVQLRNGLLFGDTHQFLIQLFAVVFTGVYAFVVTFGILKVLNMFHPVRVSEEEEILGLDNSLHGENAYEFLID